MLRQCVASLFSAHPPLQLVAGCLLHPSSPRRRGMQVRRRVTRGGCLNFATGTCWWIAWHEQCLCSDVCCGCCSQELFQHPAGSEQDGDDVAFSSWESDGRWWAGWRQACSPLVLSVTAQHSARTCVHSEFSFALSFFFLLRTQVSPCSQ